MSAANSAAAAQTLMDLFNVCFSTFNVRTSHLRRGEGNQNATECADPSPEKLLFLTRETLAATGEQMHCRLTCSVGGKFDSGVWYISIWTEPRLQSVEISLFACYYPADESTESLMQSRNYVEQLKNLLDSRNALVEYKELQIQGTEHVIQFFSSQSWNEVWNELRSK